MYEPNSLEIISETNYQFIKLSAQRNELAGFLRMSYYDLLEESYNKIFLKKHTIIKTIEAAIKVLETFDVEKPLMFLSFFEDEYTRIYYQEVHPDILKREMKGFLQKSWYEFSNQLNELNRTVTDFQNKVEKIKLLDRNYETALNDFIKTIHLCREQYHKNLSYLQKLTDYFSEPTECPPHF